MERLVASIAAVVVLAVALWLIRRAGNAVRRDIHDKE
jgi:hypothetical protein